MWVCTVIALSKSPRDPLLLSRLECSQLWCHFCRKTMTMKIMRKFFTCSGREHFHFQGKSLLRYPKPAPQDLQMAEPIFSIQIKAKAKRHAFSKCSHRGLGFILRAGRGSFLLLFTGCGRHKHPFLTRKRNFPFKIWFNAKSTDYFGKPLVRRFKTEEWWYLIKIREIKKTENIWRKYKKMLKGKLKRF